jgi:phage-related minor tail protein
VALALGVFLVVDVFAVGLVAVLDREFLAASAGRLVAFSLLAFSMFAAGGDLMAAAFVAAAALAAGAAGWAFALTGRDMVIRAVAMVTTRATESRRTRFMGEFFL